MHRHAAGGARKPCMRHALSADIRQSLFAFWRRVGVQPWRGMRVYRPGRVFRRALMMWIVALPMHALAALPVGWQAALQQAQLPADSIALWVQPVEGGAPLMSHRADQAMNPASAMKLVTTYAALEALGPAYRWKTEVYARGSVQQGVLSGDVLIKGYGDPALDVPALWQMLQQLQQQGIQRISGNLLLDGSIFAPSVGQGPVLDNEPWRAYNAQPSPWLLNGRHTSFRFQVERAEGRARIVVQPEFALPEIQVVNTLQPRAGPCNDWRSDLRYSITPMPSPNDERVTVAFSGTLPEQCDTRYLELSILSDTQYLLASFKLLWQQLGGQFNGRVQRGELRADDRLLVRWQSPPLEQVVRDINKWSNNVMARQLMLTIGLEAGMAPVDEASAALSVQHTLRQCGLQFPELVLDNGAGLSRQARISAEHLGQLLVTAYRRPLMPMFLASLPVLGVDGTTQKRLTAPETRGMGYLKTGSLEGVSSLAGYVQNRQGKRFVVVMMVNHPHAAAMRPLQDRLLQQLIAGL